MSSIDATPPPNDPQMTQINFNFPHLFSIQSQMADKDRTIRLQQNVIEQFEREKARNSSDTQSSSSDSKTETINSATQTERVSSLATLNFDF